jgi:hypothetical protein
MFHYVKPFNKGGIAMKKIAIIMAGLIVLSLNAFADDVSIDSNGNVQTGVVNPGGYGNLDVTGASGEHAVRGVTSGTGAAGVYGVNPDVSGYGGYFEGNARVTGDLTVDGSLIGPTIGDITGVTAGTGLTGGGTSGTVTLDANTTYLQRRVTGTCAAGSSIRVISATGTVTCETDDGGTYSAGTGLNLSGTTFNVNVPLNLSGSLGGQGILSAINDTVYGYGVSGSATGGNGAGVYGESSGYNGLGGFFQSTHSHGTGVLGLASYDGTGYTWGGSFRADASDGRGVEGYASHTGAVTNYGGYFQADGDSGLGVYGVASGSSGRGVYGEHSSGNYGFIGGNVDAIYGVSNSATGSGVYAQNTNTGFAGYFAGKVHVAGTFTASNKQFIQPHANDPSKEIVYIAAEAPEAVIFHRGSGQLKDGSAEIDLPEYFSVVAAEEGLQVQVTPTEECNGMFVESKGKQQIRVKELMGGKHNARFDYLVTAVRAGFEEHEPIAENSHFKPRENESAEDFTKRFSGEDLSTKAVRHMLIANGILTEDGKLNMATVKNLGWTVAGKEQEADGNRVARVENEH